MGPMAPIRPIMRGRADVTRHIRKKYGAEFGGFRGFVYLCTRNHATVPWMSGLVNGLQNRLRRFESARHLASTDARVFVFKMNARVFLSQDDEKTAPHR